MDEKFWHNCWERSTLGFHQQEIHPFLTRYFDNLRLPTDQHVFVPLCGKSLDMVWLAERLQVSGAELSDIACADFFNEKQIDYQQQAIGNFQLFSFDNLFLWQGDFFKLSPQALAPIDWIYDRAALIALPQTMQQDYVDKLITFMGANTRLLLVSVEFLAQELSGPPFPAFQSDIKALFASDNKLQVQKLASKVITDKRFAQRTLPVSSLVESLYLINY